MDTSNGIELVEQPVKGYEDRDVNITRLIGFSIGISLVIVLLIVMLHEVFTMTKEHIVYNQYLKPQSSALAEHRTHEDSLLTSYGVVNADSGRYRIPIEDAMRQIAESAKK